MELPKAQRFRLFLDRTNSAPAVSTFEDAYNLLCDTLNAVENEFTFIPYAPTHWRTDGRLYPPHTDNMRDVEGERKVKRFRSLAHNTFIAANGAVEIQEVRGAVTIFTKKGSDGRSVWG